MALKTAVQISRSLRLPDGEFFPAARKKTGIAIHHTLAGIRAYHATHAFYTTSSEDLVS